MKTLFKEKCISSWQESDESLSLGPQRLQKNLGVGTVAKKRYQAVRFPCNRMLKLSSSRGIRNDVPVLSVSWSFEDLSVIIQALRKGLDWQRLQYLDTSRNSVGVWRRNWAAAIGYSKLGRYSE